MSSNIYGGGVLGVFVTLLGGRGVALNGAGPTWGGAACRRPRDRHSPMQGPALIGYPCTGLFADEVNALVLDLGTHTFKAGYSGDDTPKAVFPSVRNPSKPSHNALACA